MIATIIEDITFVVQNVSVNGVGLIMDSALNTEKMYGTEWAWNKRENDDTISFNESQKNWMMIGIGFNVAIAVLIIASLFL